MRTVIPLVASGMSMVAMTITFVATWRSNAAPWRSRIVITLICLGTCAMCIPRLLDAEGENLVLSQGIFVGFSLSAFLVSVILPRRPV